MNACRSVYSKLKVSAWIALVLGNGFLGMSPAVLADAIPKAVTEAVADLIPGLMPDSIEPESTVDEVIIPNGKFSVS